MVDRALKRGEKLKMKKVKKQSQNVWNSFDSCMNLVIESEKKKLKRFCGGFDEFGNQ